MSTAYLLCASSLLGQEFNSEHKYQPECMLKDILNMFENLLKNAELNGWATIKKWQKHLKFLGTGPIRWFSE